MNPAFDSTKRQPAKPVKEEEDSPPGTEGTYIRGPLANPNPKPEPEPGEKPKPGMER